MDSFGDHASTLTAPARGAAAILPSDSVDLAQVSRAVYVAQSGDLSVIMADGGTVTFGNVQGGTMLPLRVSRVRSTGTSASGLVAVW